MKERIGPILAGFVVALLLLGSIAWWLPARPEEQVALRLKGYHWVARQNLCYAELELVNRSTNALLYPVVQGDPFRLSPTLMRTRQWPGWGTGAWAPSSWGVVNEMHTLEPGKTANLRVQVARGGAKPSLGIACDHVPEKVHSPIEIWLRQVVQPLSNRLKLQIAPPDLRGFLDQWIWCDSLMDPPPRPVEDSSWQNQGRHRVDSGERRRWVRECGTLWIQSCRNIPVGFRRSAGSWR